jgi:hypothetical protein
MGQREPKREDATTVTAKMDQAGANDRDRAAARFTILRRWLHHIGRPSVWIIRLAFLLDRRLRNPTGGPPSVVA